MEHTGWPVSISELGTGRLDARSRALIRLAGLAAGDGDPAGVHEYVITAMRQGYRRTRLPIPSAPCSLGRQRTAPGSDELKLAGPADRFASVRRRQLAVDASEVRFDGVDGDIHLAGDLSRAQHA
jgi:hypothetical protein